MQNVSTSFLFNGVNFCFREKIFYDIIFFEDKNKLNEAQTQGKTNMKPKDNSATCSNFNQVRTRSENEEPMKTNLLYSEGNI